jgi:predicted HTH transcriptional regulator
VLPASINRSSFKVMQESAFPVPVIREAIINVVAHRDYKVDGAKIKSPKLRYSVSR